MPIRHLVVTPLPNGRTGNTLHCSVHLSPRLRRDGVLSDYPDLRDWGTFVTTPPVLQFTPLFNGAVRAGVGTAIASPPVDPQVWRAVFDAAKVPVRAYRFRDRSSIDLTSIDSDELSSEVMGLVRTIAADGLTSAAEILAAAEPLLALLPTAQRYFGQIGDGQQPAPPSQELHDQLGALGGHPFLMRRLGLVYDLQITLPAGAGPFTDFAIRTNWPAKNGFDVHDEVPMRIQVDAGFKAVVDQRAFRTIDWLAFGGPSYAVGQLDLINAVSQMVHLRDDLTSAPTGADVAVPALLESGLSVICGDLGDVLRRRLDRQRTIEDGIDAWLLRRPNARPPLLCAEDVTLGYRCDVDDDVSAGYHSLHDRQVPAGYVFPRRPQLKVVPPADEGWGSIALSTDGGTTLIPLTRTITYHQEGQPTATKVEERDDTAWRVDDHVFTWGGWSLSTPRVGSSSTGDGRVIPRSRSAAPSTGPTQVTVEYAHVNGTLPKLRYGRTYTMRARCVDFAGNGPKLGDTPPPGAESPPVRFGRLAPLVAPLPVRRASRPDPGVGDLPDVLVIKSELGQRDASVAAADRLLFPPRISQSRLERHDLPFGGNDPRRATYELLAQRDARALSDQAIVDPETGELVAGAAIVDGQVTAGPARQAAGYLVDPAAGGVACIGLPGIAAGQPLRVSYGTWPDCTSVQLQLRAGDGPSTANAALQRITALLPQGTVQEIELSSTPDAARLEHLAFGQGLDAAATRVALRGLNELISPRRRMTLVHAVRLTLAPPSFDGMTFSRTAAGQTDVAISGNLGIHRPTTDHVVLRSRWVDTIDDVTADAPARRVTKKVITDVTIDPSGAESVERLVDARLDLGDTRRRTVGVLGESFCRFSRYFTERVEFAAPAPGTAQPLDPAGVSPATVVLTRLDSDEPLSRGVHFDVDRVAGTLQILDPTAIPVGVPCRAELIPLPVSRLSTEAPAGTRSFVFDVPSSAAPPLPGVLAALPAFARNVEATPTRITIDHDGRVVRLHLARPWFASGDGELLGIALTTDGTLTSWARDPLTAGGGPVVGPVLADFPRATATAASIDGRFDVAGHGVTFDAGRRLWTADVLVDATFGYRPFVELHACRFQPLAIDGQHVSGVVQLDPLRLGAARRVVATSVATGRVHVELSGPDDVNAVSVILQEADPDIADPDLRWHDVATTPLTRSGTTAAATHAGEIDAPSTGNERRLVIEDAEPVTVESGGALVASTVVAYREVVTLPAQW